MPIRDYHAAFDFARLGLGAVSGANAAVFSGGLTGNVGFATGVYTHGYRRYDDGTVAVNSLPDSIGLAGLTVTYDMATMLYTLSAAGVFGVAWSGLLGLEMARILGFSSSALSGASSYTSTRRPKYLIRALHPGQSSVREAYRPRGRMSYSESSSGRMSYSIGPLSRPTYAAWTQPMENQTGPTDAAWTANKGVAGAPVRRTDVGSATLVTWTWEHFYDHVSSVLPFGLLQDANVPDVMQRAWKMTGEMESFAPDRPVQDWSALESFAMSLRLVAVVLEV